MSRVDELESNHTFTVTTDRNLEIWNPEWISMSRVPQVASCTLFASSRTFFCFEQTTHRFRVQQRFFTVSTENRFFRGTFFFQVLKIEARRKPWPENPVKSEQLAGGFARERRVKRRGFLFKWQMRHPITRIQALTPISLFVVARRRPEHALFSSEPRA